jgi:hypothetical protein
MCVGEGSDAAHLARLVPVSNASFGLTARIEAREVPSRRELGTYRMRFDLFTSSQEYRCYPQPMRRFKRLASDLTLPQVLDEAWQVGVVDNALMVTGPGAATKALTLEAAEGFARRLNEALQQLRGAPK